MSEYLEKRYPLPPLNSPYIKIGDMCHDTTNFLVISQLHLET